MTVFAVVREEQRCLRPDPVIGASRARPEAAPPQAVYSPQSGTGLVRSFEGVGKVALDERRRADSHRDAVRPSCDDASDGGRALRGRPSRSSCSTDGFRTDESEITLRGLCPAWQYSPLSRRAFNNRTTHQGD
ncbi:MAG: hypothetical protein ABR925_06625 [Acidimicrobiales bacterium]